MELHFKNTKKVFLVLGVILGSKNVEFGMKVISLDYYGAWVNTRQITKSDWKYVLVTKFNLAGI